MTLRVSEVYAAGLWLHGEEDPLKYTFSKVVLGRANRAAHLVKQHPFSKVVFRVGKMGDTFRGQTGRHIY